MNYFITFILILLLFAVINFIFPHVIKLFWQKKNSKLAKESGKIFLTFDDGPESSNTEKILDTLKEYNLPATFFVLGQNVKRNSYLIKRMIREGHTIGIHGNAHLHPWKTNPWNAMKDIKDGNNILKSMGINSKYVRPPYGKINLFSYIYILINRLTFVHWNLDTEDYNKNNAGELSDVMEHEIGKGKIVLLHDGRLPGTMSAEVTSDGLKLFLKNMKFNPALFSNVSLLY